MSNIFLSWHMIVREDDDNLKLCLDSLQGLYDELVIGVDSRPESDNVFDLVQLYANVVAFRQVWSGRFDRARQDVLNRVNPKADYIGCCDSDEVLVTPPPREIRQYLYKTQPKAVNLGIKYTEDVGPNLKDNTYLRTKIWKAKYPRHWVGWIHEYPTCTGEFYLPTAARHIIFEHLKVDHKSYRTELIIEAMLSDINRGLVRWYPYLAQEYRALGNHEEAIKCCLNYITLEETENQHLKVAFEEYLFNLNKTTNNKWDVFLNSILSIINKHTYLQDKAVICEYIAMAHYYTNQLELSRDWHQRANSLRDNSSDYLFIKNNDKFFV